MKLSVSVSILMPIFLAIVPILGHAAPRRPFPVVVVPSGHCGVFLGDILEAREAANREALNQVESLIGEREKRSHDRVRQLQEEIRQGKTLDQINFNDLTDSESYYVSQYFWQLQEQLANEASGRRMSVAIQRLENGERLDSLDLSSYTEEELSVLHEIAQKIQDRNRQ